MLCWNAGGARAQYWEKVEPTVDGTLAGLGNLDRIDIQASERFVKTIFKGLTVVKPVVIGNISKYFGKKREDGHTHEWTVYLRPYKNEDYSVFIKKVHFKLHDSYGNPNRVVTKPPYEVTETGWGEFEINIRIYFNDPNERPVTVIHILKLFQAGTDPTAVNISKKPLITEAYDEIIFQEPTALLKSLLDDVKPLPGNSPNNVKHETDYEEKKKHSLEQIGQGREKVKMEIQDLKDKLNLARETIEKFKSALAGNKSADQLAAAASSTSTTSASAIPTPATVAPLSSVSTPSASATLHG